MSQAYVLYAVRILANALTDRCCPTSRTPSPERRAFMADCNRALQNLPASAGNLHQAAFEAGYRSGSHPLSQEGDLLVQITRRDSDFRAYRTWYRLSRGTETIKQHYESFRWGFKEGLERQSIRA